MFSVEIMGADGLRWALRSSKSLVPVLPPGRWVRLPRAPATFRIPTSLLERADGTALQEAWRQFLHASVMPVSLSVSAELSEKLDTDIRLSFDRMFASDLSGRAVGPPVHARAGHSQVTWCGLPAAHVARALEVDEVTCARCRALHDRRSGRRKTGALMR